MAHLGSKSTDGTLAFVKYVTKNPNWNNKKEYVIENKIQNEPVFDTRGKIVGTMSAGDPLRITEKKALRKRMMGDNKQLDYAKIKFGPSFRENGFIKISRIRKPTAGKNVMEAEENAIASINESLKKIGHPIICKVKKSSGTGYFTFKDVVGCGNVRGTPKADFTLVDSAGDPVAFISHKKAGGAKAYQQYSGITPTAGDDIHNHPETQKFLSNVIGFIDGEKLSNPMTMKVKSKKLINMAIYGPKYSPNQNSFGIDHVHFIGQGDPIFTQDKKNPEIYYLTFSDNVHTSGDSTFRGDYEPTFLATFRAGRGFDFGGKKYRGARVMIAPRILGKGRTGLLEIKL
tara:strand:- start:227 stop:1258 length:1032 start_codon:yes stop_codon:yes gene_type:complete